jgi:hypothetical protein
MHTEGHDPLRPEGTSPHRSTVRDPDHPGYEIQDVNVGGIVTFIAGLAGFILIFFIFCFFMGKAINYALIKHDGEPDRWHQADVSGATPHGEKREDLTSNAVIEQKQLAGMTQSFPAPRLETDDGNQDTADLHSREDLLLDFYSTSTDLPQGTVRIPIDRAMQLIVQRGLPQAPISTASGTQLMAGESAPIVAAPLTDGFARTGYEQETIEARDQRLQFEKAEGKK